LRKLTLSKTTVIFILALFFIVIFSVIIFISVQSKSTSSDNNPEKFVSNRFFGEFKKIFPIANNEKKYYMIGALGPMKYVSTADFTPDNVTFAFSNINPGKYESYNASADFSYWNTNAVIYTDDYTFNQVVIKDVDTLKGILSTNSMYTIHFVFIPEDSNLSSSDIKNICKKVDNSDFDKDTLETMSVICKYVQTSNKDLEKVDMEQTFNSGDIVLNDNKVIINKINY
jgi:hypothetical protein